MRKLTCILLCLFVFLFPLLAIKDLEEFFPEQTLFETMFNNEFGNFTYSTQSMSVGGNIDYKLEVGVKVIEGSTDSTEGAPFDLLGDDVMPEDNTIGRKIAYWTMSSNTKDVQCTVKCTPLSMAYTDNSGIAKTAEVPYVLRFATNNPNIKFSVAANMDSGESAVNGNESFIFVPSENPEDKITNNITIADSRIAEDGKFKIETEEEVLIVNNGEIRIFIPYYYWDEVKDDSTTPPGIYTASVTVTLESIV